MKESLNLKKKERFQDEGVSEDIYSGDRREQEKKEKKEEWGYILGVTFSGGNSSQNLLECWYKQL